MNVTIRKVIVLPSLMHWRREVIENVYGVEPSRQMMAVSREYYQKHIADGSHIAIVAELDDEDVGCGSVCLTDELPSPDNPSGRCACLMNIYVKREYRSNGIGHTIVRWLVDKARELGCGKIYLETTDGGRPLYKSLGFNELPGIMKYGETHDSEP